MSLSRMKATTCRWLWTPPRLALVTHFSTTGRRALALASVVTIDSAAIIDATRLPNMAFWWAASPPTRGPFLGRPGMPDIAGLLAAERQAPLVELLQDLVEGLLAEVGDGQQVVLGLLDQLADGVDLGPLEAVAGPLGQIEVLDEQVEVGRAAAGGAHVAELEALGGVAHVGDQPEQRPQGVAGGGQRLPGADGAVGGDVEDQAVVVGGLLDPGRLDAEGDQPDGREDRVHRDDADGARPLVAVGGHVAPAPLDGDVGGQAALGVDGGDGQVRVEDLDVAGLGDVAGGDRGRPPHVEAEGDRLVRGDPKDDVLQVEDDVGHVLLDTGEARELVERLVEAHLGDGRARDGRQQRAAQRDADGVTEARLERPDGEALAVTLLLAHGLHGRSLDDEHVRFLWSGRARLYFE